MSIEKVKNYLKKFNMQDRVMEFDSSSATVEEAANILGVESGKIAKSLSLKKNDETIIILCAGNLKIDNKKFKQQFQTKAKFLQFDEVESLVGHRVGGVCPFAINDNVKVYLDVSLKNFDYVYPACGSDSSAIKLTIAELEKVAQNFSGFVDVAK